MEKNSLDDVGASDVFSIGTADGNVLAVSFYDLAFSPFAGKTGTGSKGRRKNPACGAAPMAFRRKQTADSVVEMGASDVIKKLLPIVDNFERGFKAITDEEKETPFAKGMDMVYKQTMKMLEDLEVKPIEAVGLEFNPDVHNAVMHVEDDSVGEGIVVEEFEKGYTYRDTVIRHSMVKVAN